MRLLLLGTAAGGGFPQWNCWCPTCRAARSSPYLARPRTQSSLAATEDGRRWFLFNASPDVREQIAQLSRLPVEGVRYTPIEGIVLTDAELDHTLGIALLREGRRLQLCATASVLDTLTNDSRVLPVTQAFAHVAHDRAIRGGRRTTALRPFGHRRAYGRDHYSRPPHRRRLRLRPGVRR